MFDSLQKIFESDQIKSDKDSLAVYAKDWTTYYEPQASAVVFPKTALELQKLVKWAIDERVALVPSGGRTGLSGGAVAVQGELVVSFEKMNQILEFNDVEKTLEVEAGVITDAVKEYAAEQGLQFPLSFGATGSSQIGGNLATNAGGANVLRFGNARNWVLGLEVVTGKGDVLELNKGLVKNATGYDLRHLMIGSEGSLGFITKAILKLAPATGDSQTVLIALKDWEAVTATFAKLSQKLSLLAFEVLDQACVAKVEAAGHAKLPFEIRDLYVVFEFEKSLASSDEKLNEALGELMDEGLVLDAVPAQNSSQTAEIWALRENITEAISASKPYKNDVSVRASKIPAFVAQVEATLTQRYPGFEILWFGHVGDGNLHINILRPSAMSREDFVKKCRSVDEELFACVESFGGSVSAEHGLGLSKRDFLHHTKSGVEIELMRQIKAVFDPHGILNPGKIFPEV